MSHETSNERTLLDEMRKLLRKMRDEHIADGSLTGRTQRDGDRLLERIDVALATPETPALHLQPRYVLEQIMNNSTDPWAKGVARTCLLQSPEKS